MQFKNNNLKNIGKDLWQKPGQYIAFQPLDKNRELFQSSSDIWIGLSPLIPALSIALIILTLFKFLPPKLPFFYSLSWGQTQLATHLQFLILPGFITLITLVNLLIYWQLHEKQLFLKRVLIYTSLLTGVILTVSFIKIILIFV